MSDDMFVNVSLKIKKQIEQDVVEPFRNELHLLDDFVLSLRHFSLLKPKR